MIAPMATPIATIPQVAMMRTKIRSNGLRRRSRGGSMFLESARGGDGAPAGALDGLDSGMVTVNLTAAPVAKQSVDLDAGVRA